ncbi:hypothetical protein [Vibrio parahaemolyticus]|uniref:hypothetical protein n=1 Tax=Vibrio parahaemolyticus TaxID=670 RepID=UPI001123A168|nr:hypothetical protein [Vibrio parahaemolyticus]KAB5597628.1 hypothetical protein F0578_21070 [Vibrio parahaemolyticus]MBE3686584.1 hypothetical protein [Vibrio parahaemolyticus]MDG2786958.1 hypothetical protein [Vibrio parahaemolyticus]TOA81062.1 hypothetical protein CGK18_23380 [Vibrio parahaemolyticus]
MHYKENHFAEVKEFSFNGVVEKEIKRTEITEDFCDKFHQAVTVASKRIQAGKKPKFIRVA